MVVGGQTVSQYFIHQPNGDLSVMAGDKVILPCKVENKVGPLQWTRDGFGLGTSRSLPGFPRLSLGGEDLRRDWDLVIDKVQVEDEAEYECQVGDIRSRSARLVVNVPSGPPVIGSGRQIVRVTEGAKAELECRSEGGKPAAELEWGGDVVLTQHSTMSRNVEGFKTFVSISTVTLVAVRENDGIEVSCTASNIVSPPVSAKISLDVSYKPRVNIKRLVRTEDVKEGDDLQFICQVSAKPRDVKIGWMLEGVDVSPGEDEHILTIKNVSKQVNQKELSCTVTNRVGTGEDTLVLTVNYGPYIVLEPHTVHAREGETVHMACQAESYPPASYAWYKLGDTKVYSFTSSLTTVATNTTEGSYYCQARTSHSSSGPSSQAQLVILRRPVIDSKQTQYGDQDHSVSIICVSRHTLHNTSIAWRHKGNLLAASVRADNTDGASHHGVNDKYAVVNIAREYVIESTLTINNAMVDDFGVYTCTMENDLGMDEMKILLVNGDLPRELVVLRLVLAILGFVSCILVVCVAIRCYNNCQKSLSEEDDNQLETERSEAMLDNPTATVNARKRHKTDSSENLSDELLGSHGNIHGRVLNTISKDFAAFYGNPHLSSHMNSDDDDEDTGSVRTNLLVDQINHPKEMKAFYGNAHLSSHMQSDDDDTASVRIRLDDDKVHTPREMTAFYRNTRLSYHHNDDEICQNIRETGTRQKNVNFDPKTTVFNVRDDVSEDPYAYDDIVMEGACDVTDDDEDITTLTETKVIN